jgi:hypothetical protein
MVKVCVKQKKSPLACCGYGCLVFLVACILLILSVYIIFHVRTRLSESTLYLETENITLAKTYSIFSFQGDPRTTCFLEEVNRTTVNPRCNASTMILRENDDFFVFVEERRVRGFGTMDPKYRFENRTLFSFYRVKKNVSDDKPYEVKTDFLGSIKTNYYGAWNPRNRRLRISISPDGKYIVMSARGVNSRSLGGFRNKEVLLIWEIGDNVVEKDIVDWKGNKIPIIIKTDEEL